MLFDDFSRHFIKRYSVKRHLIGHEMRTSRGPCYFRFSISQRADRLYFCQRSAVASANTTPDRIFLPPKRQDVSSSISLCCITLFCFPRFHMIFVPYCSCDALPSSCWFPINIIRVHEPSPLMLSRQKPQTSVPQIYLGAPTTSASALQGRGRTLWRGKRAM